MFPNRCTCWWSSQKSPLISQDHKPLNLFCPHTSPTLLWATLYRSGSSQPCPDWFLSIPRNKVYGTGWGISSPGRQRSCRFSWGIGVGLGGKCGLMSIGSFWDTNKGRREKSVKVWFGCRSGMVDVTAHLSIPDLTKLPQANRSSELQGPAPWLNCLVLQLSLSFL